MNPRINWENESLLYKNKMVKIYVKMMDVKLKNVNNFTLKEQNQRSIIVKKLNCITP